MGKHSYRYLWVLVYCYNIHVTVAKQRYTSDCLLESSRKLWMLSDLKWRTILLRAYHIRTERSGCNAWTVGSLTWIDVERQDCMSGQVRSLHISLLSSLKKCLKLWTNCLLLILFSSLKNIPSYLQTTTSFKYFSMSIPNFLLSILLLLLL